MFTRTSDSSSSSHKTLPQTEHEVCDRVSVLGSIRHSLELDETLESRLTQQAVQNAALLRTEARDDALWFDPAEDVFI